MTDEEQKKAAVTNVANPIVTQVDSGFNIWAVLNSGYNNTVHNRAKLEGGDWLRAKRITKLMSEAALIWKKSPTMDQWTLTIAIRTVYTTQLEWEPKHRPSDRKEESSDFSLRNSRRLFAGTRIKQASRQACSRCVLRQKILSVWLHLLFICHQPW